jgi:hypothetical protein
LGTNGLLLELISCRRHAGGAWLRTEISLGEESIENQNWRVQYIAQGYLIHGTYH